MREAMANIASNEELARRIEQLVQEHIAANRTMAQEALERAFASAMSATTPTPITQAQRAQPSKYSKRRTSADIDAMGESFYKAVCANPGETMTVLAEVIGATSRELNRPMNRQKKAGRVRSAGAKHRTRYFPMTCGTIAGENPSSH